MGSTAVEIEERELEGCIILDIQAEKFTYPQTSVVKTHVAGLLENGYRLFVLNCQGIRVADSFGLATIVSALKMVKEQNGSLVLCGVNDTFAQLVELTCLDKVLEIWPSEAQATYYLTSQLHR